MTILDGDTLQLEHHVSNWYDTATDVLSMRPLASHDKIRQFFEEQDDQRQPALEVAVDGEKQEAALVADSVPIDEEQSETNPFCPSRTEVKKTSGKPTSSRRRKRHGGEAGCVEDDQMLLFRRSQKALRKEARHVNIKEALCRSLSGTADMPSDGSNPFSPVSTSQLSSAWSPSIAANITNRFLSNVRQQKKQTYERILHRELTNSQMSFSRLTTNDGDSNGSLPELVVSDEAAVMEPPTGDNNFLVENSTAAAPHSLAGAASNSLFSFDTLNVGSNASCSFNKSDEEDEQAQSDALMRKHELWRLRQKHLRAQRHTEEVGSSMKKGSHITPHTPLHITPTAERTVPLSSSFSSVAATKRISVTDTDGTLDAFVMSQCSVMQRSHSATVRLSSDHVEMIRRVNNFDNTSSQRVVVFNTKSTRQSKPHSSAGKFETI